MSRRRGQDGHIELSGRWYVVRWWQDVEGQEKRAHMRERICPASGPGRLSRSERERRAREIIRASGADTEELFNRVVRSRQGVTFSEQAKMWLHQIQTRKRSPVSRRTAETWRSCLDRWINPSIGNLPLAGVNNGSLKALVAKMAAAGLSASSITNYAGAVKAVVASAVNGNGDPLFLRTWNNDFIDLPVVEKRGQRTPTLTAEAINHVVANATGQLGTLYTLLAASGLRIGEALGLRVEDVLDGGSRIVVQQKAWKGHIEGYLKTEAGHREVDLHFSVARMLREFIGDRTSGLVFSTSRGRPLSQSNILTRSLYPILGEKTGFHAFRRFRATWLRKRRAPEDLIRFWLGHANKTVTDGYVKISDDLAYRKEAAEAVGTGFIVPIVPKRVIETEEEVAV